MNDNKVLNGIQHTKYLDLNHRYYIVIALTKDAEDSLFDCHFFDDNGDIKNSYEGFWFNEKMFLLMEEYFFNFIDAECDLLINMYEEEFVFPDKLPQVLSIINRMMKECDNTEVLQLAEKLRNLIEKAIKLDTAVGFCF